MMSADLRVAPALELAETDDVHSGRILRARWTSVATIAAASLAGLAMGCTVFGRMGSVGRGRSTPRLSFGALGGIDNRASGGFDLAHLGNESQSPDDDWVGFMTEGRPEEYDPFQHQADFVDAEIGNLLQTDVDIAGQFYRGLEDYHALHAASRSSLAEPFQAIRDITTRQQVAEWLAVGGKADFGIPMLWAEPRVFKGSPTASLCIHAYPYAKMDVYHSNWFRRTQYQMYVKGMFLKAGWDSYASVAKVQRLDAKLAALLQRCDRLRFVPKNVTEIADATPEFPWSSFTAKLGLPDVVALSVGGLPDTAVLPEAGGLLAIAQVLGTEEIHTLKDWLAFHFIVDARSYILQDPLASDSRLIADRIREVARVVPFAVGDLYTKSAALDQRKTEMEKIVNLVMKALKSQVGVLERDRLGEINVEIFNPSGWPAMVNHSSIDFDENDLLGSARRALALHWRSRAAQVGKAASEWRERSPNLGPRAPHVVDVSYSEATNTLLVTAAAATPPFLDLQAEMPVNLGAIGFQIAHAALSALGPDERDRAEYDIVGGFNLCKRTSMDDKVEKKALELMSQVDQVHNIYNMTTKYEIDPADLLQRLRALEAVVEAYRLWRSDSGSHYTPREPHLIVDDSDQEGLRRVFAGYTAVMIGWPSRPVRRGLPVMPPFAAGIVPVLNTAAWYKAYGITESSELYLTPTERVAAWDGTDPLAESADQKSVLSGAADVSFVAKRPAEIAGRKGIEQVDSATVEAEQFAKQFAAELPTIAFHNVDNATLAPKQDVH